METIRVNSFSFDNNSGKKIVVQECNAELHIQAGELLLMSGRPVVIDSYKRIIDDEDNQADGNVSLFINVPERYRPEVTRVVAAGWQVVHILSNDIYNWPDEAAALVVTYAMKREAESITGNKLRTKDYPDLEAN